MAGLHSAASTFAAASFDIPQLREGPSKLWKSTEVADAAAAPRVPCRRQRPTACCRRRVKKKAPGRMICSTSYATQRHIDQSLAADDANLQQRSSVTEGGLWSTK